MKLSPSEQESIVALLTRIYKDIHGIEEEFQLLVDEHDFRPRIEYFHDAVRELSVQDPDQPKSAGRLSVELLAYDLSCLRYIQSKPLAPFRPHADRLSPHTDLVNVEPALLVQGKRPDRAVRERISDLYRHYAVLFAALLKPFADRDYHGRVDNINQDVEDLHDLVGQLQALAAGKSSGSRIASAAAHLEETELRQELLHFIQEQKYKKKEHLKKLIAFLKAYAARKDKDIAAIEKAHMNYALAQLAIFEDSKDMLKKMATQGMNLVGRFVENAVAEARREMGR